MLKGREENNMYYGNVQNQNHSALLPANFADCLTFMKSALTAPVTDGTTAAVNDECVAHYQRYLTKASADATFESHLKFYDVQFMVRGEELLGIAHTDTLEPANDYDPDRDLVTYQQPTAATGAVVLHAGDFAIVGPCDAHQPGVALGDPEEVEKIVIKVPVIIQ